MKAGIGDRQREPGHGADHEQGRRSGGKAPGLAEDRRKGASVEGDHARASLQGAPHRRGCERDRATDSGRPQAAHWPHTRAPRTDPPRSGDTIAPVPGARGASAQRRPTDSAPAVLPASSSELSASRSSGRIVPVSASEKLTIDTPEQIALEFPLASAGSRFLALAIDSLVQIGGFLVLGSLALLARLVRRDQRIGRRHVGTGRGSSSSGSSSTTDTTRCSRCCGTARPPASGRSACA